MERQRISRTLRSQRGQAIAEGTAMMCVITLLSVGLILLILGAGSVMYYKLKVAEAAMAGATAALSNKTWLGMPRPVGNQMDSQTKASEAVRNALTVMGFPPQSVQSAQITCNENSTPPSVTVTVNGLPILSGGILPSVVQITDTAASPLAGLNLTPPAIVGITLPLPGGGHQGIYVPSYGAGCGASSNTSGSAASASWQSMVAPCINGNLGYNQFTINPGCGTWDAPEPKKGWSGGPQFTSY